jgi:hypothetical protein
MTRTATSTEALRYFGSIMVGFGSIALQAPHLTAKPQDHSPLALKHIKARGACVSPTHASRTGFRQPPNRIVTLRRSQRDSAISSRPESVLTMMRFFATTTGRMVRDHLGNIGRVD